MPEPSIDAPRHPDLRIQQPGLTVSLATESPITITGTAEDADEVTAIAWRNMCGAHQESTGSATLTALSTHRKSWTATVTLMHGLNVIIITATSGNQATAWAAAMVVHPPPA